MRIFLLVVVPSSRFQLLATLCIAEQNSASVFFCASLSTFDAISDNAIRMIFIANFFGSGWPGPSS